MGIDIIKHTNWMKQKKDIMNFLLKIKSLPIIWQETKKVIYFPKTDFQFAVIQMNIF